AERGGFWALSKFEVVRHVGRSTDLFSSARGTLISDAGDRDGNGPHMEGAHHLIRSDPPAHTELRRLVSNSFRPRAVKALEGKTRRIIRRSEEHTSELQSRENLVCRLLLEKKKK